MSVGDSILPSYDMNPYKDDSLYGFLERPRIINTVEWTNSLSAGDLLATIDPYFELLTSTPFLRKLENFQYIKGGLRIGVRTNGTPFHYGKLMVVWKPMIGSLTQEQQEMRNNIFTASGYPNIIVSPTENEVNEMVVPFAYNTAYIDLSQDIMRSPGALYIYVLNPLALNTAVPPVSVTTFANLEGVKLAGQSGIVNLPLHQQQTLYPDPNPFNPVTNGAKVVRSSYEAQGDVIVEARQKSTAGLISGPAKAVSSVAGALVAVPGIGIWASAVSTVSGALGKLAEHLGYCKPNTLESLRPYLQKNGDFAAGEGLDSAMKTQVIPSEYVTDFTDELGGTKGEMEVLSIAGTPTLLGMFTWDGNNVPDSRLYTAPVSPLAATVRTQGTTDRICPSLLYWMSRPFELWRGSLRYDVQITCSNFHSGRLRVSFQPKNNGVVTGFDYQNTINRIVDIQTETDFSFTVPFINDRPWAFVGNATIDDTIGFIEFSVVNDLTHTDLPVPEVHINVWVSAGPDFQLAMPVRRTNRFFGPIAITSDGDDQEEGYEAQGLTSLAMKERDHPPLLPDAVGAVEHNICQVDTVTHLKQVTNRPAQFTEATLISTAANETIVDLFNVTGPNTGSTVDYIDWYSNIFVFARGSLNIRMVPKYTMELTQFWIWMRHSWAINGFIQTVRANPGPNGFGQQLFTTLATPSKEVNIPFYNSAFARILGAAGDGGNWGSCFGTQLAKPTELTNPKYDIYRSTGDDYNFIYKVGAPTFFLQSPVVVDSITKIDGSTDHLPLRRTD